MQREIASLAAACGLRTFLYHTFPNPIIEPTNPILVAHRSVPADAVTPAVAEPLLARPAVAADPTGGCVLPEPWRSNTSTMAIPRPAVLPVPFPIAPPPPTIQSVPAPAPRQRRSFAMLHEVRDTLDTARHQTCPTSEHSDQ